jgi:hypothetical protein
MAETIAELESRSRDNLARVRGFVDLYERTAGAVAGRPSVQESDLLRAAVVFLHATFEDFLRSLATIRLPLAGAEILRLIPFAGGDGRRTTLTLGDLHAFRGRTVDDVLRESVEAHLDQTSYNNTDDLARHLIQIRLDPALMQPYAAHLAALMSRRHHVAHRFDRNESTGRGHQRARSIGRIAVAGWIEDVELFIGDVLRAVASEVSGVQTRRGP